MLAIQVQDTPGIQVRSLRLWLGQTGCGVVHLLSESLMLKKEKI
jgi:hypothetical protein